MKSKLPYLLGLLVYLSFMIFLYQSNFLVFHIIIEITGFMLAFSFVLVVTIGLKENRSNISILMTGVMLSSIVLILHIISYKDMNIIEGYGSNEATQFWIAANLVLSLSFLLYSLTGIAKHNNKHVNYGLTGLTGVLVVLIIFGLFPNAYVEGEGLTAFKIVMEYLFILIYIITGFFIVYKKDEFNLKFFYDFMLVIVLLIFAELMFTNYIGVFDLSNAIGHLIRVIALYILVLSSTYVYIKEPLNKSIVDLGAEVEDLKLSFKEVEKNAEIFRALYDDAPLGYQSLDETGHFIIVNETYARLLGYKKEEMIGKFFGDFMSEESTLSMYDNFAAFKERGSVDVIFNMVHKKGNIIPVRFLGKIAYNKKGAFKQTHCILMDISNEVEYQKGIIESKDKLEDIINLTSEGVYTIDKQGLCTSVNIKALEFFDVSNESDILGKDIHALFHHHKYTGEEIAKEECSAFQCMEEGVAKLLVNDVFTKSSGRKFDVIVNAYPIMDAGNVIGATVSFRDKEKNSNIVESLVNLTYHDTLTGLFNRRYYEEEIKNINNESNYPLSLVIADINGLKLINDAFGHLAGDKLLLSATEVFIHHSKNKDFIARIGGDEFIIVMPNTTTEEAEKRVIEMNDSCKDYSVKSVQLSISFGIKTMESSKDNIDTVYKAAEDSMYRMKLLDVPSMRSNTIDTIVRALYEKDVYSEEHSRGVSRLSQEIASRMSLSYQQINDARMAGLLHDIGKIAITSQILNKEGKLTVEEYDTMKQHSEIGFRILNSSNDLRQLADIVLSHHEWWNGTGYPNGAKSDEIPLISRIITVADAFDAMTTERTYREKLSDEDALKEIQEFSGVQFDPKVVQVFTDNFKDILKRVHSTI